MEHRKEYASHRDMLDDALLQRILADMADDNSYGRSGCNKSSRDTRQKEHGCSESSHDNRQGGCGCGDSSRMPRQNSCGCGESSRPSRQNNCGCCESSRMAKQNDGGDRSGGCGCNRNEHTQNRQTVENYPAAHGCVSGRNTARLQGFPLAMVYSPNQEWEGIFEPEEALAKGTLFAGLIFPWYPSKCRDGYGCGCGRD